MSAGHVTPLRSEKEREREHPGGAPQAPPDRPEPRQRVGPARWAADLATGARFAVSGGRESWARTVLTAVGVGLGVALLLIAAAVPHIVSAREDRSNARSYSSGYSIDVKPGPDTLRLGFGSTTFRGSNITGLLLAPDGDRPPMPPGVDRIPAPGEMVVSPALKKLLADGDSKLLRERLDDKIVGTIGDEGLAGPAELIYYAGANPDALWATDNRLDHWGDDSPKQEDLDPTLLLLIVVGCVVLLLPVAIFIATAVRFGGERRDRRLAALRLVGADSRMTRRIAAGEALVGSLLGLAVGTGIFLLVRQFIGGVAVFGTSVFPSDVQPSATITALIMLAVPTCAVVVTQIALRGITIEPLGVVRNATPKPRRLWWRLLFPVLGLALLLPRLSSGAGSDNASMYQVAAGAVLMLVGITALLPWLVEAVVKRFGGGPVPWQLATRRLQLSSGAASRAVSGITVAVAGAIAITMLFAAAESDNTTSTGQDPTRADVMAHTPVDTGAQARDAIAQYTGTKGVRDALGFTDGMVSDPRSKAKALGDIPVQSVMVGDCPTLKELARVGDCRDGDVFVTKPAKWDDKDTYFTKPGATVNLSFDEDYNPSRNKPLLWTIPRSAPVVDPKEDPQGTEHSGILATPGALDIADLNNPSVQMMLRLDSKVPDAIEYARNTAARLSSQSDIYELHGTRQSDEFRTIKRGLFIGASATLLLIGASMIVSMLEQLRERKKLLSVLVAFGTRRTTLGWSVLWQTAIPVVLGLALSVAGGIALGAILLKMVDMPIAVDWASVTMMTGIGAGVILLVTLVSMGPLWRMMRPDGLRTE
ncbi:ABC transporter permease [Streptomyces sp. ME19-01-6]|uniref:ABC transporter permease n=1 Tax=Streptomyces sp. ME19-01-6 TaxID=3028686 RepID=UPI0029A15F2E|nr:FtsX-like permease family protein [Streptomyces sp. ME19-01-6]MDX3225876.1 ABC transporter permease [Streptomyces sp. ME19-01-6]